MIPTAEEFLLRQGCQRMNCDGEICDFFEDVQPKDFIEFAKLHVQAALQAKIEAMEKHDDSGYSLDELDSFTCNAYPLENIK